MTAPGLDAPAVPIPRMAVFITMMASLIALSALSIDVILPALPEIRASVGIESPNWQQLVITYYMLGFAVGQLFYGPVSDWLGRRPVLFAGIVIYAAATLACIATSDAGFLLAARFVQGLGGASPRIVAVAVVRDAYGGRRMAEIMSFVMMVFIGIPIVAPLLGAGLLLAGSWQLIFALLLIVSLAMLYWMWTTLPETHGPEKRERLSLPWIHEAVGAIADSRIALGYTLATGTTFGCIMAYINSAQQVFVEVYGLDVWFPIVFGFIAIGILIASFLNGRLVGRIGMRRISHGAMIGFFAASAIATAFALRATPPLPVFMVLIAASQFCIGLIMPNINSIAMEPMGRIAGTASSFIGAATTALAAAFGWIIGQQFDGTVLPLTAGMATLGAATLLITLITERGRLFHATV